MTEPARTHEDVRRILADQISAGRLRPGSGSVPSARSPPIGFSHDLFRGDRTRIVVRTPGKGSVTRASRGRGK
jgi:hypothetical protein